MPWLPVGCAAWVIVSMTLGPLVGQYLRSRQPPEYDPDRTEDET